MEYQIKRNYPDCEQCDLHLKTENNKIIKMYNIRISEAREMLASLKHAITPVESDH